MSQEQGSQSEGQNGSVEKAVDANEALHGDRPTARVDWNEPSSIEGMTKPQVDMAHQVADQTDPEAPTTRLDDALAPWTHRGLDTPESDETAEEADK
jgi:hypothetical protein